MQIGKHNLTKFALVFAALVAVTSFVGGAVATSVFTPSTVTQSVGYYQVSSQAPTVFPTAPTATVTTIPSSGCSSSTSTSPLAVSAPPTLTVYQVGPLGSCTPNHWAEELSFTSATLSGTASTHTFTISTSYVDSSGVTQTPPPLLAYISTGTATGVASVNFYIDYGAAAPQSITTLTISVS